jgi:hypothetical protein
MSKSQLTPQDGENLMLFQAPFNGGRGSSVAKTVATLLQRGDIEGATQVWRIDSDKVCQYPGLMAYMNCLFGTDYSY